MSGPYNRKYEFAISTCPGGVEIKAGAAGTLGTTSKPVVLADGVSRNAMIHHMTASVANIQLVSHETKKLIKDLTLATVADWELMTLGEIALAADPTFDENLIDIVYAEADATTKTQTIKFAALLSTSFC